MKSRTRREKRIGKRISKGVAIIAVTAAFCLSGCAVEEPIKRDDVVPLENVPGMVRVEGEATECSVSDDNEKVLLGLMDCTDESTVANADSVCEKLLDNFLAGKISADGNGLYGDGSFMISELQMNEEEWDSYRIGDRLDLDNDGVDELILSGPYGGMYLDASEDQVKVFAIGEGTASNLSYTYCDNEFWIVHSDTMHSGRKYYRFDKYFGADNPIESVILEMDYSSESKTDSSKYYFNGEEISEPEYNELYQKYAGNVVSQ